MPDHPAPRPESSPRVSLRDVVREDLPVLFAMQSEPEGCDLAMVRPRPLAEFTAIWERILRDLAAGTSDVVSKAIMEDAELRGSIGVFQLEGRTSVGYMIGREHWGRGLASRALALLLAEHPRRPLYARAAASNAASIRVLTRNGFVATGTQHSPGTDRYLECDEVCFVLG